MPVTASPSTSTASSLTLLSLPALFVVLWATGFIAAMTTTMLASAWLLDRFGVRKTLSAAMAMFTLISLAGGLAPTPELLIAARIGQGAMAGLMQPMGMYLVFRIFPADQRGRAMGIYGMGVILAPALGPVLGGFLVDQFHWRWVMFAPAPVTLLGVWMALRFLPSPRSRPAPYMFDLSGMVLLGAAVAVTLETLNRLQDWPGDSVRIAWQGALAASLITGFIVHERRTAHPLIRLALLREPLRAGRPAWACGGRDSPETSEPKRSPRLRCRAGRSFPR